MPALAAIVVFPALTLILFGLAKVEALLTQAAASADHRQPAEPADPGEKPSE